MSYVWKEIKDIMKVFKAEYGRAPDGEECSVIFADDMEEAKEFIIDSIPEIIFVDDTSNYDWEESLYVTDTPYLECKIYEIPIEKGIVYTGYYYCC